MPKVEASEESGRPGVYRWLSEQEGHPRHRLEAFRSGRAVDVLLWMLPSWAQVRGLTPERLGYRAVVHPDDAITVAPVTAAQWCEETGL